MNAVEIEEAVSALAEQAFDAAEFPFAFLAAFGNKEATIKKLRTGASNKSDIGGVLQVNHIHLKVAEPGAARATLDALRASEATQNKRNKVRFILATDGEMFEAEDLESGDPVACAYTDFPNHFGFFLPLARISTVRQIREKPVAPRERFLVPLFVIDEAFGRIRDGTIADYVYDPKSARLVVSRSAD